MNIVGYYITRITEGDSVSRLARALLEGDFMVGAHVIHHTSQRQGVIKSKLYKRGDITYHEISFPDGQVEVLPSDKLARLSPDDDQIAQQRAQIAQAQQAQQAQAQEPTS